MSNSDKEYDKNYPQYIEKIYTFDITSGQRPERVDVFLTRAILNATRTKVQKAIDDGNVKVNGLPIKASRKVLPGDMLECTIMKPPPLELVPENIPLDILYEDEFLAVVNKPGGMCTHPGFGNRYGTLVNALLFHFGVRESVPIEIDDEDEEEGVIYAGEGVRPGIVHRLDKDTSGLLVIAKNSATHAALASQFADRTTEREYNAIVWGIPKSPEGSVEGNIGRSQKDRKLFTVAHRGGKYAKTDYTMIDEFEYTSLLKFKLHTGRTHQIRVHAAHIKLPVFGDIFYGGDKVVYGGENLKFKRKAEKCLKLINRQMLHARTLGFHHPDIDEFMRFECPLPADFVEVMKILKEELSAE